MEKVGIFFGSTTGNTADIAKKLGKMLSGDTELFDVSSASEEDLKEFSNIIFGASTWGDGELQEDWESFIDVVKGADFSGKKVAIFGLGDQDSYPDTFNDAIGIIYDAVEAQGGTLVGAVPNDGYSFSGSAALRGDMLVGLALDEDTQSNLTDERLGTWVDAISGEFA